MKRLVAIGMIVAMGQSVMGAKTETGCECVTGCRQSVSKPWCKTTYGCGHFYAEPGQMAYYWDYCGLEGQQPPAQAKRPPTGTILSDTGCECESGCTKGVSVSRAWCKTKYYCGNYESQLIGSGYYWDTCDVAFKGTLTMRPPAHQVAPVIAATPNNQPTLHEQQQQQQPVTASLSVPNLKCTAVNATSFLCTPSTKK